MTVQQLKYMVTVAEKGKISEAAQELFISQPSLTNAIHDLENEVGFSILTVRIVELQLRRKKTTTNMMLPFVNAVQQKL